MKDINKNKGITLITLVVTIVVLLILAGISVAMLTGENGIISQAIKASDASKKANIDEIVRVNLLEQETLDLTTYETFENIKEDLDDLNLTQEEIQEIKFEYGLRNEPNPPELGENMIPVKYDEEEQQFIETIETDPKWYNYEIQESMTQNGGTSEWANAITKDSSGRITGYWVWIPRFEYKILDEGVEELLKDGEDILATPNGAKQIDIEFIPSNQVNPEIGYTVHPAFQNGDYNNNGQPDTGEYLYGEWDSEISGFWISKYSESNQEALYQATRDTLFVPNRFMKMETDIGASYQRMLDLNNEGNLFGFTEKDDTHMIKNSEWGAVAYLGHSQYGRNGTELRDNNFHPNWHYITGTAGSTHNGGWILDYPEDINRYNGEYGMLNSTTGNVYGVYDMHGTVKQHVAAYYINGTNETLINGEEMIYIGGSQINGLDTIGNKYKTVFASNTSENEQLYNGGVIFETKGWYYDYFKIFDSSNPFLIKNGGPHAQAYNTWPGMFYNLLSNGVTTTTRAVVIINN